jgi:hypothetical protein
MMISDLDFGDVIATFTNTQGTESNFSPEDLLLAAKTLNNHHNSTIYQANIQSTFDEEI